jgi:hypothetical protein
MWFSPKFISLIFNAFIYPSLAELKSPNLFKVADKLEIVDAYYGWFSPKFY